MLNFNNTLTSKIISLIVAVSFLMADISYAGAYQQGGLRVPMGGQGGTYKRAKGVIDEQRLKDYGQQPKFKRALTQVDTYKNIRLKKAKTALQYIKQFFKFSGKFDQAMLKKMHRKFQSLPNDKKLEFNRKLLHIIYSIEQLKRTSSGKKPGKVKSVGKIIAIESSTILDLSIRFEKLSKLDGELAPWMYMVKPGSSGPNVARVIDNLGSRDTIISFYGFTSGLEGDIFKIVLEDELKYVGVEASFFEGAPKTSLFIFAPNPESPEASPLEFPMRPSNPKLDNAGGEELIGVLQKLPKAGHKEFIVLGGQLFPGLQPDKFYPRCIRMLKEKGYRVFFNFQPYMEDDEMMAIVKGSPVAIKPNLKEFSRLAQRYFNLASLDLTSESTIPVIGSMALRIAQENSIDFLVVSMDERGAIGVYIDGLNNGETKRYRVIHIDAPKVKVESTVACGSSLIGAAVRRLTLDEYEKGEPDYVKALLEGVAAGSATAEKPGTGIADTQRFEELLEVMNKAPGGPVHFLDVKPFELATQLIEAGVLQNAEKTRREI